MNIFNTESDLHPSACRRNLFAFAALFIIVLTIYSNTFHASWHFDDLSNINERRALHLTQLTWPEIKKTFFFEGGEEGGKLYRPVVNFTFALNYYFGGLNVVGYHLVNISLHILTSIFLFLFIFHLLKLPLLKPKYGNNAYFIALVSAVFWAINPVQTQAVTYIVQRMASMAAMFYIMAMYFYLRGRTSTERTSRIRYFFMCLVCCVLALGSKENAAMLPFSIFLFDIYLIQGISKNNIKKSIIVILGLFILLAGVAVVLKGPSIFNPEKLLSYPAHRPFSLWERLLTEPRIVLFYISQLFYPMPQRLSISHDIDISHGLLNPPTTLISICLIVGVLGVCVFKARRWPLITFCVIFFFLNHLIEGSIFPLELIFEHRNYLPSMLIFVPLAVLLAKGMDYYTKKAAMQAILAAFIVLVWVGFGHSTFMRNFDWETEGTIWMDACQKAPRLSRPHINLGTYYTQKEAYQLALIEFKMAVSGKILNNNTNYPLSLYNLGHVYQMMGDTDQALSYYKKASALWPSYADTYNNMGVIYTDKDLPQEAENCFKETIRYQSQHLKANRNLGLLLLKQGRIEEAFAYLQNAILISPHDPAVIACMGYANRLRGFFGPAYIFFNRALNYASPDPKLHLYMAEIFFRRGLKEKAAKHIAAFIKYGKLPDLRGYIIGTYPNEDEIAAIEAPKKMVLSTLAAFYDKSASELVEKATYVKNKIATLDRGLE